MLDFDKRSSILEVFFGTMLLIFSGGTTPNPYDTVSNVVEMEVLFSKWS